MPIGWFGSDVVDFVGDSASDVGDAFTEVTRVIPLGPELTGALKDLVNGPLRDFARSPAGMTVLRAMSTTLYGPLAWSIGPQVAALAFAVPGLARGEDFWHAWLSELQWRAQKTAELVLPSAGDALAAEVADTTKQLAQLLPEQVRSYAVSELAQRLNVKEYVVAKAEWALGLMPGFDQNAYDLATGKLKTTPTSRIAVGKRSGVASSTPRDPCVQAADARAEGMPAAIVRALEQKCDAASAAIAGGAAVATAAPASSSSSSSATNVALGVLAGGVVLGIAWYFLRD